MVKWIVVMKIQPSICLDDWGKPRKKPQSGWSAPGFERGTSWMRVSCVTMEPPRSVKLGFVSVNSPRETCFVDILCSILTMLQHSEQCTCTLTSQLATEVYLVSNFCIVTIIFTNVFVLINQLPLGRHRQLARWCNWRACDVGEAKEGLENELWHRWSNGRVGEWTVT